MVCAMSGILTRRQLVSAGIATAAGAAGVGIGSRYLTLTPDHKSLLGLGESLTYSMQRLLTSGQSLAREFPSSRISKVHPTNGPAPIDPAYRKMLANGFTDWRLRVEGLVARPASFSLDELKRLPAENHITLHACEQGWSYIAQWTGVRLSHILDLAGTRPEARYVMLVPIPNPQEHTGIVRQFWDSIDVAEALHPQTLIAYGMNGGDLPPDHGAPVRLRLTRQLGYKNVKYLSRIVLADSMDKFGGTRTGTGTATWYGGI
jgi:DMSO/TMAO reductase YedYZ molybdopterin-dependent catalytic subunit